MALKNFLLAGFGGQGILFSGKVIAYSGLMDGKEVSWLPSYGPEMRGGTANCSVCIRRTHRFPAGPVSGCFDGNELAVF